MSLLPLKGQPVSLTLILFELAHPERKRYTKAHSCRNECVRSRSGIALFISPGVLFIIKAAYFLERMKAAR